MKIKIPRVNMGSNIEYAFLIIGIILLLIISDDSQPIVVYLIIFSIVFFTVIVAFYYYYVFFKGYKDSKIKAFVYSIILSLSLLSGFIVLESHHFELILKLLIVSFFMIVLISLVNLVRK